MRGRGEAWALEGTDSGRLRRPRGVRTRPVVGGTAVCERRTEPETFFRAGAPQSASKETPRQQLPYK